MPSLLILLPAKSKYIEISHDLSASAVFYHPVVVIFTLKGDNSPMSVLAEWRKDMALIPS